MTLRLYGGAYLQGKLLWPLHELPYQILCYPDLLRNVNVHLPSILHSSELKYLGQWKCNFVMDLRAFWSIFAHLLFLFLTRANVTYECVAMPKLHILAHYIYVAWSVLPFNILLTDDVEIKVYTFNVNQNFS